MSDCIFCRIATKDIPAEVLHESEHTLIFPDKFPKARVHVLGIPKEHIPSLQQVTPQHEVVVGQLLRELTDAAQAAGIGESGYRVITNVGAHSGQEVSHLHFHLIGGEPLGPLRC